MTPGAALPCVLYDDSCGFCRRWVPFWGPTLLRHGFAIAPLQSPWVAEAIPLPADELLHDIRLLLPTGDHLHGAEAYRYVMRRIWWASLQLYLLSDRGFPGSRVSSTSAPDVHANRHGFPRACGLPGGGG